MAAQPGGAGADDVLVEVDEKITRVTFNRPDHLNAITLKMAESLQTVATRLTALADRDEARSSC